MIRLTNFNVLQFSYFDGSNRFGISNFKCTCNSGIAAYSYFNRAIKVRSQVNFKIGQFDFSSTGRTCNTSQGQLQELVVIASNIRSNSTDITAVYYINITCGIPLSTGGQTKSNGSAGYPAACSRLINKEVANFNSVLSGNSIFTGTFFNRQPKICKFSNGQGLFGHVSTRKFDFQFIASFYNSVINFYRQTEKGYSARSSCSTCSYRIGNGFVISSNHCSSKVVGGTGITPCI